MFAPRRFLALAAIVASVNAACVHRSSGPAYSSSALASSTVVPPTSSAAAPTSTALASSLVTAPASSITPTSSIAQELTTSSYSSSTPAATNQAAATSASSSGVSSASAATSSSSGDTKYLVVFGDSYSSTGFYIEGDKPSVSSPIGSPSLPGTTTSGGLNWVGLVTSEYNTSTVLTYDWAYYGADVSNAIINTGVTTDVIAQVAAFEENLVPAPSYAPWTAENLLVAVWIGINDIGECFWESAVYATCPIDDVMTKYFSLLQSLYDDGVRNFVLNTVPPFYKAPSFADQTDLSTLIANLDSYNAALLSNLATFKANNADITVGQIFNTTSYMWQVLDDPTSFGLDSDITCANSDGTTCAWYDGYHPGQAFHKLVAQGFMDALTGSFF
ncbi:unnamed protein product [Discula destructiva]